MAQAKESVLIVCSNRKAYHDYFIEDTYEAGLELLGAEVKSIRQKELSLEGSFVRVENGEAFIYQMHVKPYKFNSLTETDPTRVRRLLLTKKELRKLQSKADIKGYALVPLEVYFKKGWAKVKLAVAKGKHSFDKRDALKKKDLNREMEQTFKNKIRFWNSFKNNFYFCVEFSIIYLHWAGGGMADAHGSGPCGRKSLRVQLPFRP